MDIIFKKVVISMTVGEAVRERILELCKERNLSINKLCSISGVVSSADDVVQGGLPKPAAAAQRVQRQPSFSAQSQYPQLQRFL